MGAPALYKISPQRERSVLPDTKQPLNARDQQRKNPSEAVMPPEIKQLSTIFWLDASLDVPAITTAPHKWKSFWSNGSPKCVP